MAVPSLLALVPPAPTIKTSGGLLPGAAVAAETNPLSGQLQQQQQPPAGLPVKSMEQKVVEAGKSRLAGSLRSAAQGGSRQQPPGVPVDDNGDEDEGSESGEVVAEEGGAAEDVSAPAAAGVNRQRMECKACKQLGIKKYGQPWTILSAPVYVRGHCRGLQWTNNDGKKDPAGYHKAWLAEMEEVWKEGKAWKKAE